MMRPNVQKIKKIIFSILLTFLCIYKANTNVTESDSDSESWESDCPLFMTKLPKKPNPGFDDFPKLDFIDLKNEWPRFSFFFQALDALSHILYEETTPEERAEHFKEEGNRLLKLGIVHFETVQF